MRIFLAGDYYSGTGPANVTKYYIENLPKDTLYQKRRNKFLRAFEIAFNTLRADAVVYSGYSKQVILGAKIAKRFKKPCAYLMHGCVEYENRINREEDEEMAKCEREILRLCDAVYAVSPRFCKWLKDNYSEYSDKFDYVANAIDTDLKKSSALSDDGRDNHMIFTVGGGMPRKKINVLCKAVKLLRENYDSKMYLTVIGDKGADSEEIDSYDFVDNRHIVNFEDAAKLYKKAALFVQNSCFETFGLAPVEAVSSGCSMLASKEIGALFLFPNVEQFDIIEDYEDPVEIADKIKYLIENPNADRLVSGIDWERDSWKIRSQTLLEKLSQLILKK